jgi:hypothetical protein
MNPFVMLQWSDWTTLNVDGDFINKLSDRAAFLGETNVRRIIGIAGAYRNMLADPFFDKLGKPKDRDPQVEQKKAYMKHLYDLMSQLLCAVGSIRLDLIMPQDEQEKKEEILGLLDGVEIELNWPKLPAKQPPSKLEPVLK